MKTAEEGEKRLEQLAHASSDTRIFGLWPRSSVAQQSWKMILPKRTR